MQVILNEDYIKARIDEIIADLKDEYSSRHELTTIVANYDYYCGKLSMLLSVTGDAMWAITYRADEIRELQRDFNERYVNTLYRRSRRAEARMKAFADYGAKEVWL